jgi:DNA-binding transcriptional LysR family regulator
MARPDNFDKIELHLVRVLHVLITERSVSRAALKLRTTQPAVSAQLKRLRELTGDALLVRAGNGMTPTATAMALAAPAANLLHEAERLFSARGRSSPSFEPVACDATFRIAASDYLDPLFLPELVARVKRLAPHTRLELHALSGDYDYRRSLAAGNLDLVVGNWLEPPGELHMAKLMSDEIVCLVAEDHPVARMGAGARRGWTTEQYLASEHVAPTPLHPGARGVIDEYLSSQRLAREVVVRSSHFSLIPLMVAQSMLVLTTGRLFCSRYVDTLPLAIVKCPVPFPPLTYYQLWHELTQHASSQRWLREQVKDVARTLATRGLPARRAATPA